MVNTSDTPQDGKPCFQCPPWLVFALPPYDSNRFRYNSSTQSLTTILQALEALKEWPTLEEL